MVGIQPFTYAPVLENNNTGSLEQLGILLHYSAEEEGRKERHNHLGEPWERDGGKRNSYRDKGDRDERRRH